MLTDTQKWLALAGLVLAGWLLYLLGPILAPFLLAALLGYLGDPLVDRLAGRRMSRTVASLLVLVLFGMILLLLPLLLLPLLQAQLEALARVVPALVDWVANRVLPWIGAHLGVEMTLPDVERVKSLLAGHWREAGGVAASVAGYVTRSGLALVGFVSGLVLVPVVTFYMLRDWDGIVSGIMDLLPRSVAPDIGAIAREADQVLGAFLRGQLLVMVCLGTIYSVGLWLAGLELALIIGLLAGLVSFVPYLGVIIGLLMASLAVLVQSQDLLQLVWVLVVFGVGQTLEGMVLTPWIVGDRIGLHPVAVIFAILAGGQLFGFVGVLLALPVAAVLAVLVRHTRRHYQESAFYRGRPGPGGAAPPAIADDPER